MTEELKASLLGLRRSARSLRQTSTEKKNSALRGLAKALQTNQEKILKANEQDIKNLAADTLTSFRDRLLLTKLRIETMTESLVQVSNLPDPVGETVETATLKNGLRVRRVRSPLGVILMIFESRPNVIIEAFSLAFKSGNAILLRGGSEAKFTAQELYRIMRAALKEADFDQIPFLGLEDYDRSLVERLLKQKDLIDIVVPRGGDRLIDFVQRTALMPIIKNDRGLCHVYVDDEADLKMAVEIVRNAKVQRPGVCNSMETVLVHSKIAEQFLPKLFQATEGDSLTWHTDETSLKILKGRKSVSLAKDADWDTEYLDLIMNCKIVTGLDEALAHIENHGSKHSECIVTSSQAKARRFQDEVDAAAVYWNASTRFTDGFELGLGGELGISTQKLHVRGPVGLRELTTPRWIIEGDGQTRG
jgi:glutamate-5-semialdehyde dehydrogenase